MVRALEPDLSPSPLLGDLRFSGSFPPALPFLTSIPAISHTLAVRGLSLPPPLSALIEHSVNCGLRKPGTLLL